MKREKIDSSLERQFLSSLVHNRPFLIGAAALLDPELFPASHARRVAQWAVDYFQKYKEPAGEALRSLCGAWVTSETPEDGDRQAVEDFVEVVLDQTPMPESSAAHLLDELANYLTNRKLQILNDSLSSALVNGRKDEALTAVSEFKSVSLNEAAGYSPAIGKAVWTETFAQPTEGIISWPPAAEWFFGPAFVRGGLVGMQAPEKVGKCVAGDSLVLLESGQSVPIRDIVRQKIGQRVIAFNENTLRFEPKRITEYWNNGKKRCVRITTKSGRSVSTTSNHKYLTPDGWKEIGNIKDGDFIAVPKNTHVFGNKLEPQYEINFISYMLAEGCCVLTYKNKDGERVQNGSACTFTSADPTMMVDFKKCCAALGVKTRPTGQDITIQLSGNARSILKKYNVYGCSAKTKKIPPQVLSLPRPQLAEFVRIFFSCDGSIFNSTGGLPHIELGLANEFLIYQFVEVLLRFGIIGKVRPKTSSCKKFKAWTLRIASQEHVHLFLKNINFISYKMTPHNGMGCGKKRSFLDVVPPQCAKTIIEELRKEPTFKKTKKLDAALYEINRGNPVMRTSFSEFTKTEAYKKYLNSDMMWDKVVLVKTVGKTDTYDLSVEELHNFVADSCIVHNTWVCNDICYWAARSHLNVAVFQVGDLTKQELNLRWGMRVARMPMWERDCHGTICPPTKINLYRNSDGSQRAEVHRGPPLTFPGPIDATSAYRAQKKFNRTFKIDKERPTLMFSVHQNSTINVSGIDNILMRWREELNFIPDVTVIDYGDILAPEDFRKESRDQVNDTWKALRRLSQKWNCCTIVPTQANAATYKQKGVQGKENFSNDKRKLAHVTAMMGLNQTDKEKEEGIMRLNWIALRGAPFNAKRCLWVATCFPLGVALGPVAS